MDGDEFAGIRSSAREVLCAALAKADLAAVAATAENPSTRVAETAAAVEEAVCRATLGRAGQTKAHYACAVQQLAAYSAHPLGLHPTDTAGCRLLRGELRPGDAIAAANGGYEPPSPRDTITAMFAATLMRASAEFRHDRGRVLDCARAIEQSCFNAVVAECKRVENPPRRQWDSPAFVDMYSARCGRVNVLLDPGSSSCAAYGAVLVPQLLRGEVKAAAVGKMSCGELCPDASTKEREEIARRSCQKIENKTSNFFKCPSCGERKSTYIEKFVRGTDEMPDYMCTCSACGTRFKGKS